MWGVYAMPADHTDEGSVVLSGGGVTDCQPVCLSMCSGLCVHAWMFLFIVCVCVRGV